MQEFFVVDFIMKSSSSDKMLWPLVKLCETVTAARQKTRSALIFLTLQQGKDLVHASRLN